MNGSGPIQGPGSRPDGDRSGFPTVLTGPLADGYRRQVRFGVLGALSVLDETGEPVRLGGPARRRLLAALLARVGRTVSVDTLIDDLWGDNPPATAEKTLQSHVVRLRDDLGRVGGSPLLTEATGYRLDISDAAVDAWCFERDVDAGRLALARADASGAVAGLDAALDWWRGEPYGEFADAAFAVSERLRLAELHSLAVEARTDALLATGAGVELVPDLEARLHSDPYRERSWEQLVVALYRGGRQRDALMAYRRARDRLVEDLGLEPSKSLRLLEGRVLEQDETLLGPAALERVVVPLPNGTDLISGRSVGPCPYRGLAGYDETDGAVFVGRERLTAELAGRLVDNDLLVVVGPSGAGKSSLVRAGLVPALWGGAIPGSSAWRISTITPGAAPLEVLNDLRPDLLVVDQAEELFTVTATGDRVPVGRRLASLLASGTRVVLVLRADFYGRLADLEVLTGRIGSATVLVGSMTEAEVRRVITVPASAAGVTVSPEVVEVALADVRGQSGTLPLLSSALEQAWARREGNQLTLESYHRGGGVRGALESMAERVFGGLDAAGQAAARRLLLRLSTRSGGVWARRALPQAEAAPAADPAATAALEALVQARLVSVGSGGVELTHEALLAGWPRLHDWLEDRALVAGQLEHLAASATAWEEAGRPAADLLRGPRLQAALDWQHAHPDDVSAVEGEFLDSSRALVEAEISQERHRRRRLTIATAGLGIAALVAALIGGVAVHEGRKANAAAISADAQKLAALSYSAPDLPMSLLLSAAAYRLQDSPDSRGALLSAVQRDGGALTRIPTANRLLWMGATRDGSRLLALDNTRTLIVLDAKTHATLASYPLPANNIADASPDGRTVVGCGPSTAENGTGHGRAIVMQDGSYQQTLPSLASPAITHCGAFTHDGRWFGLLALSSPLPTDPNAPPPPADELAVYDAHNWSLPPRIIRMPSPIVAAATSMSDFAIQLVDGTLQVRDAATLAVVTSHTRPDLANESPNYGAIALSLDGKLVAFVTVNAPQTPQMVFTSDLTGPTRSGQGLSSSVNTLAFSPDRKYLGAGGADGSVVVYRVADASTTIAPLGHTASVNAITWTGSGASLALFSAGLDSEIVSWELDALPRSVVLGPGIPAIDTDVTPSLYGDRVIGIRTGVDGPELFATDVSSGATGSWPLGLGDKDIVNYVAGSADGSRAVVTVLHAAQSASFQVWDVVAGRKLIDMTLPWSDPDVGLQALLTADGKQMLASVGRRTFDLVDVSSSRVLRATTVPVGTDKDTAAFPMLLDGSGHVLLVVDHFLTNAHSAVPGAVDALVPDSHALELMDLSTSAVVAKAQFRDIYAFPDFAAWSPDMSRVALGTYLGTISVYDAKTLAPVNDAIVGHAGFVQALSWSPEGDMLVSTGTDGNVDFWDASSLRRIGSPVVLPGGNAPPLAWYSPTGSVYGYTPSSKTDPHTDRTFTMPGTPQQWLADACAYAGRDITPAEWNRYVDGRPYQSVCPTA